MPVSKQKNIYKDYKILKKYIDELGCFGYYGVYELPQNRKK